MKLRSIVTLPKSLRGLLLNIMKVDTFTLKSDYRKSILEFCGMPRLHDVEKNRLWNTHTVQSLINACVGQLILKAYASDKIPAQTTECFSFFMGCEEDIKSQFRMLIIDALQSGPPRLPIQDPAVGSLLKKMVRDAENYKLEK